jgi:RNA polymerase sigma-54 factor
MAISQKLHTKLVQKLILTPSLQQAIKLLPMSTLELSELLNQEMVENPMLEEVPTEELSRSKRPGKGREKPAAEKEKDTWDDQDYEYFFGDYLDDGYRPRTPTEVKELPPIENTLSTAASLSDHLLWQLSMQTDDPKLRRSAKRSSATSTTTATSWRRSKNCRAWGHGRPNRSRVALRLVQGFDPIGVASRDLQECLLLQLRHLDMAGSPAERIVTEAHAPAAKPPGAGAGAKARDVD